MNVSQAECESIEPKIRAVLENHPSTIINRDAILIGISGPKSRRPDKLEKDVYRANLRRKITTVMKRIVDEGEWEVYGSTRNPRWRRVS
jgi:hypothetical protein